MKKQRFTQEPIIGVLRAQEAGAKTADLCATTASRKRIENWKAKYGIWRHGSVRGEAVDGAGR
jgi:putative transposase